MTIRVPVEDLGTFTSIPTLTLPNQTQAVDIGDILTDFLIMDHNVPCCVCQTMCRANIIAEKGMFTILAFNRTYYYDREGKIQFRYFLLVSKNFFYLLTKHLQKESKLYFTERKLRPT